MNAITVPTDESTRLQIAADRIRHHALTMTHSAGSGHPTSAMSCAEIMATLFFHELRFDLDHPDHLINDRFVLSKGHASPALWAVLAEAGAIKPSDLETYRSTGSAIEGHPTPRHPLIDVATGALGQGLSAGTGMAWLSNYWGVDNQIWVLLGDGECAEGAVWEAINWAGHEQMANLCAIVDVNRLGQTGETMFGHDVDAYSCRFAAFDWNVIVVDGHDIGELSQAYDQARKNDNQPTAIIAKTLKGKGVSFLEDADNRHGKPVTDDELDKALTEVNAPEMTNNLWVRPPEGEAPNSPVFSRDLPPLPDFDGEEATRKAYAETLRALVEHDERIAVFDAELSNSTKTETVKESRRRRFVECFIAEQNMIGMAMGAAALGSIPYCSSFAAFHLRAADQIRMAAISQVHMIIAGSHAGVATGEDGPSQMGLEDLSFFRALPGSSVLCPSDALSARELTAQARDTEGIVYLRLARPKTPVLDEQIDQVRIGGSRILRGGEESDTLTIVASGTTVPEALEAADRAKKDHAIDVRVIDAYSLKPFDVETVRSAATATHNLITVEDHYPEGGLGETTASAIAGLPCRLTRLAVNELPCSGPGDELMAKYGIDADAILDAVRENAES